MGLSLALYIAIIHWFIKGLLPDLYSHHISRARLAQPLIIFLSKAPTMEIASGCVIDKRFRGEFLSYVATSATPYSSVIAKEVYFLNRSKSTEEGLIRSLLLYKLPSKDGRVDGLVRLLTIQPPLCIHGQTLIIRRLTFTVSTCIFLFITLVSPGNLLLLANCAGVKSNRLEQRDSSLKHQPHPWGNQEFFL